VDGTGDIDGTRIENWRSTRKTMKNTRKDKAKESKRRPGSAGEDADWKIDLKNVTSDYSQRRSRF